MRHDVDELHIGRAFLRGLQRRATTLEWVGLGACVLLVLLILLTVAR